MARKSRSDIKVEEVVFEKRFGIGEWYGRPFESLTATERAKLAQIAIAHRDSGSESTTAQEVPYCPFASKPGHQVRCWKKGGVCSLQKVQRQKAKRGAPSRPAELISGLEGSPRIVCPSRFQQADTVFNWVGEVLLENPVPKWVTQVRFLKRVKKTVDEETKSTEKDVGNIDAVLLSPGTHPLQWAALEIQAVYFSGERMLDLFRHVMNSSDPLPYPDKGRRPDYRSSGAKRLMPQLQTKVPTLRRWGKKMAVVVDEAFFDNLGEIPTVEDVSNCDIVWFVVGIERTGSEFLLVRRPPKFTTLEAAVDGLTNGKPVTLREFESQVLQKHAAREATGAAEAIIEPSQDSD